MIFTCKIIIYENVSLIISSEKCSSNRGLVPQMQDKKVHSHENHENISY